MAADAWAWRRARRDSTGVLAASQRPQAPRLLPTPEKPADAHSANPSPHKAA